jgi:hypothetical protein
MPNESDYAVTVEEMVLLRSKISYLIGYTDIPAWVESTPYREKLKGLVEDLEKTFQKAFGINVEV